MIEQELLIPALVAIGILVTFGLGVFATRILAPRQEASPLTGDGMKLFEQRLGAVEKRVESTEHDVKNVRMVVGGLATKDSVNDVKLQLGEMKGELKAVGVSTSAMAHSLERVENFLMKAAAETIASVNESGRGSGT